MSAQGQGHAAALEDRIGYKFADKTRCSNAR